MGLSEPSNTTMSKILLSDDDPDIPKMGAIAWEEDGRQR